MFRATILTGIILSAVYAVGQDAISPKPSAANDDDTAYSNECLALAYRLPDGWKFAKSTQASASHQSNQQMSLFTIKRQSGAGSAESLALNVMQPPLKHPDMERFTILLALSFVHVDSAKNKITRNAYPVTIAGRSFFRSDLRSGEKAVSLFATWYRGYAVIGAASADSPQDVEETVNALGALTFGEDKRTADCFGPTK